MSLFICDECRMEEQRRASVRLEALELVAVRAKELMQSWGVAFDDGRLGYIEVQVGRRDVDDLVEALKALGE